MRSGEGDFGRFTPGMFCCKSVALRYRALLLAVAGHHPGVWQPMDDSGWRAKSLGSSVCLQGAVSFPAWH